MDKNILSALKKDKNCIFFVLNKNYEYIDYSFEHKFIMKKIWNIDIKKGTSIFEYIQNDNDKQKAKDNFDKVLGGKSLTVKEKYGHHGFFRTLWQNSCSPLFDENKNICGILVFVTELTEYIKIQNQFNELKIFEQIINLIKVGVTIVDPNEEDMPLIFVNDAFVQSTGYKKEEVLGKNCRFLQKDNKEQTARYIIKNAIANKQSCEVEIINYKKNDTKFINLLNISPIFNQKGKLLYYVGIQLDITNSIEKNKLETLKDIASGLTHEINTALASLKGNLEILEYDITHVKDLKIKAYINDSIKQIKQSIKTIAKITNSLHYLNISSTQTKEKFNLYDSIEEAIDFFKTKIYSKNINISINHTQNIKVFAEKESIIHLWKILIENAIDAVSEKNIPRTIEIYIEQISNVVSVDIKDNGSGINENIKMDIFKPLVKTKNYKGVGIGLSTAKTIVDIHQGQLSFRSDKEGTVFEIILPIINKGKNNEYN